MDIGKYKKNIIVFLIVYLLLDIVVIGSFLVINSELDSSVSFISRINLIAEKMPTVMINPFSVIGKIFSNSKLLSDFFTASFYTLLVCIGGFIYYKIKFKKKDYEGKELGSSDWAKDGEEFRKTSDGKEILNRKSGFILSRKHYLGTDIKKVGINKNILVIGGSGTGKSACYIKPNILQTLGSYVITDPKGELYRETSGFLKEQGYKVRALNLVNPEYSDRYNPLAHIIEHEDVDKIADTIVAGATKTQSNDPFWNDTAKMLLKACIYYVISVLPEEEQNLSSCMNIIRAGGSDERLFEKLFLEELKPHHPGRVQYENFKTAADKTMQSIIISTISKVETFDTPAMQRITTSNNIDFDELGEQKTAIFVITPAEHGAYDYVLSIFFGQLLQILYAQANRNGGRLKNQVYLLLDEFANIGQIPDFNRKLSTTRSLGISISIVIQSLDQIEGLYKDNYENIIGNCDTQLFLGSQSIKTCEYFSKSLGQKTIKYESMSVSKDKKEKEKQSVSISEQKQARDLMTIDELKRLDNNDEIILVRGLRPILAKKAWYFKYHPMKDVAKKTEIHDITEMPKPKKVEIRTMDVEEHMENRMKKAKEAILEKKDNYSNIDELDDKIKRAEENQKTETTTSKQEFDLQKELERKFDELFGETENH